MNNTIKVNHANMNTMRLTATSLSNIANALSDYILKYVCDPNTLLTELSIAVMQSTMDSGPIFQTAIHLADIIREFSISSADTVGCKNSNNNSGSMEKNIVNNMNIIAVNLTSNGNNASDSKENTDAHVHDNTKMGKYHVHDDLPSTNGNDTVNLKTDVLSDPTTSINSTTIGMVVRSGPSQGKTSVGESMVMSRGLRGVRIKGKRDKRKVYTERKEEVMNTLNVDTNMESPAEQVSEPTVDLPIDSINTNGHDSNHVMEDNNKSDDGNNANNRVHATEDIGNVLTKKRIRKKTFKNNKNKKIKNSHYEISSDNIEDELGMQTNANPPQVVQSYNLRNGNKVHPVLSHKPKQDTNQYVIPWPVDSSLPKATIEFCSNLDESLLSEPTVRWWQESMKELSSVLPPWLVSCGSDDMLKWLDQPAYGISTAQVNIGSKKLFNCRLDSFEI